MPSWVPSQFAPLDLLSIYREEVLSILGRNGLASPRVTGLVAGGANLPDAVPVELLVDREHQDEIAAELGGAERDLAALIGRPVRLVLADRESTDHGPAVAL